jgi:hypothetical protein
LLSFDYRRGFAPKGIDPHGQAETDGIMGHESMSFLKRFSKLKNAAPGYSSRPVFDVYTIPSTHCLGPTKARFPAALKEIADYPKIHYAVARKVPDLACETSPSTRI